MADRSAGEITIGGNVPIALLEEFLEEVRSIGALVGDYEGPPFDAKTAEQLRQTLDEYGNLKLVDAEASYGMFQELEAFLQKHGIPFDRHSDGQYEFDCVNVFFREGMERPLEMLSNKSGETLMRLDGLHRIAGELVYLAGATIAKDEMAAAVAKVSKKLNQLLPPEVEGLPPLSVTE